MAASQARFLGLTARKTNVEYEGQQVNQQRTALANESAGLYNQMLALKVPTPPSATDFYNTRYVLENATGNGDVTITKWDTSSTGNYSVNLNYTYSDTVGYQYGVFGTGIAWDQGTQGSGYKYKIGDCELKDATADDSERILKIIKDQKLDGVDDFNKFYKYSVTNGETVSTYYVTKEQVQAACQTDPASGLKTTQSLINRYYAGIGTRKVNTTADAAFKSTQDGRFESVQLSNISTEGVDDDAAKAALTAIQGKTYDLDFTEVQDETGYSEAMKEYEYEKMMYERSIQDINAKTEIIQQQDRTLELRLKQLDTEQEALKTEMDAVKEVIQNNTESTFKTFA